MHCLAIHAARPNRWREQGKRSVDGANYFGSLVLLAHLKLITWVHCHVARYWFPQDICYVQVSLHRNSIVQAFRFVRLT